jgi:SPP1 family holin
MNNKLSEKTMGFIRLALFAFPLINTILVMSGVAPLPFDEFQLENILIMVVGFIAGIWAWWKDNAVTEKAIAEKEMVKILTENEENK